MSIDCHNDIIKSNIIAYSSSCMHQPHISSDYLIAVQTYSLKPYVAGCTMSLKESLGTLAVWWHLQECLQSIAVVLYSWLQRMQSLVSQATPPIRGKVGLVTVRTSSSSDQNWSHPTRFENWIFWHYLHTCKCINKHAPHAVLPEHLLRVVTSRIHSLKQLLHTAWTTRCAHGHQTPLSSDWGCGLRDYAITSYSSWVLLWVFTANAALSLGAIPRSAGGKRDHTKNHALGHGQGIPWISTWSDIVLSCYLHEDSSQTLLPWGWLEHLVETLASYTEQLSCP